MDAFRKKRDVYTSRGMAPKMRTCVDIDEKLMRAALRVSGMNTRRAVVEAGLRLLVQTRAQAKIRRIRNKSRLHR
jgi:Arc/MetJ family transcription regulator